MKKLLIMSIALVAIMATVFTVSAFAANTVTIGDDITVAKYYDTEGNFNDAYAVVTVPFEASEGVDRLTFYFAAQDLSSALEGEEAKVIYIDEQVKPETGNVTFVIEKARIKSALTAASIINATDTHAAVEGLALTFKLGGTDVDAAASKTVAYTNPTIYGDVTGDGQLKSNDAARILRKSVEDETLTLTDEQLVKADVNGDGRYRSNDASYVLRCSVENITYAELLEKHTYSY